MRNRGGQTIEELHYIDIVIHYQLGAGGSGQQVGRWGGVDR